MGDVVNLNKFRKSQAKDQKVKHATKNRQKFGQSKAEKLKSDKQKMDADTQLDGKKLDDNTPK